MMYLEEAAIHIRQVLMAFVQNEQITVSVVEI